MNIIELANKAGFRESGASGIIGIDAFLERFATLVRAEYETPLKLAEEALQHAPSVMTKEALAAIREALADHSGDGNEMVAEQPNLNCPSVQARLAKVWGHVKAEPVKQEPVTNLFDVKKKAFEQLRLEVKAPDDKWTVGESINFFGFYSHGFDAGIKYANSVQPVKQEPVAWVKGDDVILASRWPAVSAPDGYTPLVYAAHMNTAIPAAYMFKVKRTLPSSTPLDVFAAIEYHPLPHEDIISKEPLYSHPVRTKDLTEKWIDPNDKSQQQYLPHIGEKVLFCCDGEVYYGHHTGGAFQKGHGVTKSLFPTWDCMWMHLPTAFIAPNREKNK